MFLQSFCEKLYIRCNDPDVNLSPFHRHLMWYTDFYHRLAIFNISIAYQYTYRISYRLCVIFLKLSCSLFTYVLFLFSILIIHSCYLVKKYCLIGDKINKIKNMRHSINTFHFPNSTGWSRIILMTIQLPSWYSTPEPNASSVPIQYKHRSKLRRLAMKLYLYVHLFIAGYL